jgi:fatty-acyl-CoA synthase
MMRGLMMDFPLTLAALLRHTERSHGGQKVVSRSSDRSLYRYTYGDCLERARRLGAALRGLGAVPGDRLATFCWNHSRHLEAYYGVPASGFVLHTLNIRLHSDELAYIATHAGDRIVVVDKALWPAFEKFAKNVSFERIIVVTDDGSVPDGTINYDHLVESAKAEPFPDLPDENAAAAMCYTSGTTGKPKGVVYSHRSLVLHTLAAGMPDLFGVNASDTVLPVVPMFHANAWGLPFVAALAGAKQVLPGAFLDPQSVVELLEREGVTVAAGVPTIWSGILQYLEANPGKHDLSRIRFMIVGGSAVPESMIRSFQERHGLRIVQAWGMTEMSPLGSITSLRSDLGSLDADARYAYGATQGMAAPFVEIRARNEDGFVPWDNATMGELEVRGPWISASYYHADDDAREKFTDDGWFRTGDVVTIAQGGHITIQDRSKDLVKSGGEWISSVQLESALMGHPDVAEAAVVAVAHPKWGERPLAVVVPKPGRQPTTASLIGHLADKFPKWWLPDDCVLTETLPRTATGKLKKTDLRATHKDHYSGALGAEKALAM